MPEALAFVSYRFNTRVGDLTCLGLAHKGLQTHEAFRRRGELKYSYVLEDRAGTSIRRFYVDEKAIFEKRPVSIEELLTHEVKQYRRYAILRVKCGLRIAQYADSCFFWCTDNIFNIYVNGHLLKKYRV